MKLDVCPWVAVIVFGVLTMPLPRMTAAPVPKGEAVTADDITPDRFELLETRRIQREIKMTPDQRAKLLDGLDVLLDDLRATHEAADLPRVPARGAPPLPERDYDSERKAFEAKKRAFAATVLTPKQLARLAEVEVQLIGEFAPMNPRVSEKMKLSDKQKKRVVEVLSGNEDFRPVAQLVDPNRVPFAHKTPAQMRELVEKELTAAQRKVWAELAGEKTVFDVDKTQSDFRVRGTYRVMLRPEGWVDDFPEKGGVGR